MLMNELNRLSLPDLASGSSGLPEIR